MNLAYHQILPSHASCVLIHCQVIPVVWNNLCHAIQLFLNCHYLFCSGNLLWALHGEGKNIFEWSNNEIGKVGCENWKRVGKESVKDEQVGKWPSFMQMHAIVHKIWTQQLTRSHDWLGTVRIKVPWECKSQRLSTSRNGVFPISQVSLDCLVCPAKPLSHPMSIWVDPNHFSAFPASFPSFPITCPNSIPADQWLICCAYSIQVSFIIISLFPLPICIPADR